MVTPLQIGLQLIDWTDPQKAMYATRFIPSYLLHLLTLPVYSQSDSVSPDESIQFDIACEMTRLLYVEGQSAAIQEFEPRNTTDNETSTEDERKLLCQLLPKLYIPDEIDDLKIKCLLVLIESLKLVCPTLIPLDSTADGWTQIAEPAAGGHGVEERAPPVRDGLAQDVRRAHRGAHPG